MTDWTVFFDVHGHLPQEGPGSEASTARALAMIPGLPDSPNILDIGCGPGRQTVDLARQTGGRVRAVDLLPHSVAHTRQRAEDAGLADRVEVQVGKMQELDFPDESFDLIWSEGAIYNMGFEAGLRAWRRLLVPDGAIAVTEASWLVADPPADLAAWWANEYPGMADRAENWRRAESAGYTRLGDFVLPESDWWAYYDPMAARIREVAPRYEDDPSALETLQAFWQEIEMYRAHSAECGYVFYVMSKGPGLA